MAIPDTSWMDDALCIDKNPEIFFALQRFHGQLQTRLHRYAKKICNTCPVQEACAEWGNRLQVRHGLFGGTVPTGHPKKEEPEAEAS